MSDSNRSHAKCWAGTGYRHVCHEPSGRSCIECGAPAGTWWGPYYCPECDVTRLDRCSAGMDRMLDELAVQAELTRKYG